MNLHLKIFHIYHFVMVKLQIQFWAIIFYQIIWKKLVPNYQTNPKNIYERKKRNGRINSNFGTIINLTNSS